MTTDRRTNLNFRKPASFTLPSHPLITAALMVARFTWHYVEMMVAMMIGASLFELLAGWLPASTRYATGLRPGTFLYSGGIALAMMVVMVAWMLVRGHGWRPGVEMSVAMLVPVAGVAVISKLSGDASLAWFQENYCSAMCVGMLVAMLFRWRHYTGIAHHAAHAAHGHSH